MAQHIKRSGVYQIRNTKNGKQYVGSSKDITRRFSEHRCELRKGKHHNKHLQNAWVLYGEDAFVFEITELTACDQKILVEREQHYLDTLQPEYNILQQAVLTDVSPETRKKISKVQKGRPSPRKGKTYDLPDDVRHRIGSGWRGKNLPDEVREKMSEVRKGKGKTDEWREKIAESVKARHNDPTEAMLSGHKKGAEKKREWKWITNGTKNKRIHISELDLVDEGWYPGRTISKRV
jgi:group I intron endonuclease